jgi:ribosome maturation factor RimP
MKNKKVLEVIIKKTCDKMGMKLYDWQLKGRENAQSLVIYISKPDGVTLDDCQRVSKRLGEELDMRDIFNARYVLEVSSPGLSRYLRNPQHFLDAIGETVKIRYLDNEENLKTVKGVLNATDENSISVKVNNEKSIKILYVQIEKARTVF